MECIMIEKLTPPTEAESELINLLIEEMSEVTKVLTKINRFGFESFHPDDVNKVTNRKLFEEEMGDVLCIAEIIINRGIISFDSVYAAIESKKERLKKFSNVFSEQNL
jgi:NTP pyrophosphatase (non-canonical NTP hydrolase)